MGDSDGVFGHENGTGDVTGPGGKTLVSLGNAENKELRGVETQRPHAHAHAHARTHARTPTGPDLLEHSLTHVPFHPWRRHC